MLSDDQYLQFLMFITQQVTTLRNGNRPPESNAGPRYHETKTYTVQDEGFARWMGWRGEAEQERETAWPADELKAERLERSRRELWKENQELKGLLRFIQLEIGKRIGLGT